MSDKDLDIDEILSEMNEKHIIILLYLLEAGSLLKVDIRRAIGKEGRLASSTYTDSLLLKLREWGLIREKVIGKRYKMYELTEKGKKLASFLRMLAKE